MTFTPQQIEDGEKKAQRLIQWRDDFWKFFCDCIKTTDEGTGEVRLAPRFRYLRELHHQIERAKTIEVVKTRQMYATHFMAARFLWRCLFHENLRLGIMNQKEDDAADLIETRVVPLYERLPEGYPWPRLEITRLMIVNQEMNSRITAFSSSTNATRGKTFTEIWLDEFGFQENQEKTLRAAIPATNGPLAKLVIVSTPVPHTQFHELAVKELDPEFEVQEIMTGMTVAKNLRGHTVVTIGFAADPAKRSPEWEQEKRREIGELAFEVEYGLRWLMPAGKPVFSGFQRSVFCAPYRRFGVLDGVAIEEGWDFGDLRPAWVAAQRDPLGRLIVHHAVVAYDQDLYAFMDRIAELRTQLFGQLDYRMYCDPAGATRTGQGSAPPAQVLLQQRFHKTVRSIKSSPSDRVTAIKQLMGKLIAGTPGLVLHPMLGDWISPDGHEEHGVMIEGFETGLVWDQTSGGVAKMTYRKDKKYEDFFDAFGYMFIYLYPGLMPIDFEERMAKREKLAEGHRSQMQQRRAMRMRR